MSVLNVCNAAPPTPTTSATLTTSSSTATVTMSAPAIGQNDDHSELFIDMSLLPIVIDNERSITCKRNTSMIDLRTYKLLSFIRAACIFHLTSMGFSSTSEFVAVEIKLEPTPLLVYSRAYGTISTASYNVPG